METYILYTESKEFYCGKTNYLNKRMYEHKNGIHGSWFNNDKRKTFQIILLINGDFEKSIKKFGVKKYYLSLLNQTKINKKFMVGDTEQSEVSLPW